MANSITDQQLGLRLDWQSALATETPSLKAGELHIWKVPLLLDESLRPLAISLLNDTQRDKYHRRINQQLKQSYLAGRYYLMHLLAGYSERDPHDILLSYSRLNKPYLNPNPEQLEFNYTDTTLNGQSWGLFAFTLGRAVGVDIECLDRKTNFAAIADRRLANAELDYVRKPDGGVDAHRFLACWTRKEAYGKATGQGINFTMRDIDLASPGKFELDFISDQDPATPYRLIQMEIEPNLIGAVVVEGHQPLKILAFNSENHIP